VCLSADAKNFLFLAKWFNILCCAMVNYFEKKNILELETSHRLANILYRFIKNTAIAIQVLIPYKLQGQQTFFHH